MTVPKEMFVPSNRNEWTLLVRPPDGYRLDSAIGTTFGLDFTALTALLLAMLDRTDKESAWEAQANRLQAITSVGERVRVFANRGQIHADIRTSNQVFALLDRIVDDVHLEKGSFHPKVWVLKYLPRRPVDLDAAASGKDRNAKNDAIYRLLCTSKNLTLYSSWEAVIRLDGCIVGTDDEHADTLGGQLAEFFRQLVKDAAPLSPQLKRLLQELPRVAFSMEGSRGIKSCEFLWQWPGERPLLDRIVRGGDTALVVSPFTGAGFLRVLAKSFKHLFVVSRQEELDAFWDESMERLIPHENVWVVKADAADASAEEGATSHLDLHAKLLFCGYSRRKGAARTEAWLGSANASPRGWGLAESMNCEAMIRFTPAIQPKLFLEQFAYQPGKSDSKADIPALNGWIEPYIPRSPEPETEEQRVDGILDAAKKAFAGIGLTAHLERIDGTIAFALRASSPAECQSLFASYPEVRFHAAPLGLVQSNDGGLTDLACLAVGAVLFDNLQIHEVGTLFLVRLRHEPSSSERHFVIQVAMDVSDEFWEERRSAFLKAHLSPRDFRQFLRSILFDGTIVPDPPKGGGDREHGNEKDPKEPRQPSLLDDMTVEDILHACTQDRSRIDEVDRLMRTFEGTEHVDLQFRTFWTNFREALRVLEKGARR